MTNPKNVRQHILDTGKTLIAGKGFSAVGLTELLASAGVPKGSFYHYFRSKEAFGEALLDGYFDDYCAGLSALLFPSVSADPAVIASDRMLDRLLNYWQRWIDVQSHPDLQEKCLVVKLSGEVCDLSDCMRSVLQQGTDRVVKILADAVSQIIRDGDLPAGTDAAETAAILYDIWLGATLLTKIRRDDSALRLAFRTTRQLLGVPRG